VSTIAVSLVLVIAHRWEISVFSATSHGSTRAADHRLADATDAADAADTAARNAKTRS
ncbi:hypothetical protein X777_15219, partial [Ooceraea biroi]